MLYSLDFAFEASLTQHVHLRLRSVNNQPLLNRPLLLHMQILSRALSRRTDDQLRLQVPILRHVPDLADLLVREGIVVL